MNFFIQGDPKAQPRIKARAITGNNGRTFTQVYTPKKTTEAWRQSIRAALHEQCRLAAFDGAVKIQFDFRFERPKSHYRTGKNSDLLKNSAPLFHTQKPDCDNLAKLILDEFQAFGLFRDDCDVVHLTTVKRWVGKNPGCEVSVVCLSDLNALLRIDANAKGDPMCQCENEGAHTASNKEDSEYLK